MSEKFIPSFYNINSLDLFGITIAAQGFKNDHKVQYNYCVKVKTLLKTLLGYAEKTNAENLSILRTLYSKVDGFDETYDIPEFEYWNYRRSSAGYTDCMRFKTNDSIYAKIEKFGVKVNTYSFKDESDKKYIGCFAVELSNGETVIENMMFRINVYETETNMFDIVYCGVLYEDFDIHNELAVTVVMDV